MELNLIGLLLIFTRIAGAIVFLPLMTQSKGVPTIAKAGVSFALAIVVYTTPGIVLPQMSFESAELMTVSVLVIKELLVGIALSYSINVFFQIYYFAGQLWGMQGGLSQSMVADSSTGSQVSEIGKYYALAFGIVFLSSGGYHWFISSLVSSFKYIPIGKGVFKESLMWTVVDVASTFWEVGFKVAAPITCVLFIVDCGLGILARTVPQMNMFAIGVPLKASILFIFMLLTLCLFEPTNTLIMNEMVDAFFDIAKGMMP